MKKKTQKEITHKITSLNLADFCAIEDPESISEDGLFVLALHSNEMGQDNWKLVECGRDEVNAEIIHLHYQREES